MSFISIGCQLIGLVTQSKLSRSETLQLRCLNLLLVRSARTQVNTCCTGVKFTPSPNTLTVTPPMSHVCPNLAKLDNWIGFKQDVEQE